MTGNARIEAERTQLRAAQLSVVGAGTGPGSARQVEPARLDPARSALAIPLMLGSERLGMLYIDPEHPDALAAGIEPVLRSVAAALAALCGEPVAKPAAGVAHQPKAQLTIVYYQADDSVLCDSEYIAKGVPGRILWRMLSDHAATGRTQFTNRELRLDERLGLPPGNDNLESRLLVLRRRLADRDCGISLQRTGRGHLQLTLTKRVALHEVATLGPMRAAHQKAS